MRDADSYLPSATVAYFTRKVAAKTLMILLLHTMSPTACNTAFTRALLLYGHFSRHVMLLKCAKSTRMYAPFRRFRRFHAIAMYHARVQRCLEGSTKM